MMGVFWFVGIEKKSEELLRPSSPWMPFPTLISVLSKVLASRDIALISKFYKDKKVSAFSCLHLCLSVLLVCFSHCELIHLTG